MRHWLGGLLAGLVALPLVGWTSPLADTVQRIKPGIVGVGTSMLLRSPRDRFRGTGFVVGNGRYIVTNAHVLPDELDSEHRERLVIFSGRGEKAHIHGVETVGVDRAHDLALLRLKKTRTLAPLKLGEAAAVREGEDYAFTGFPIGVVLGLYPVTHRGIVSAITPVVNPARSARQLNARLVRRMEKPYRVFQLDATAYPGNSGSPLYEVATGRVVGVINKVFVKETKETLLARPSGITYAIPVRYVKRLLKKHQVSY